MNEHREEELALFQDDLRNFLERDLYPKASILQEKGLELDAMEYWVSSKYLDEMLAEWIPQYCCGNVSFRVRSSYDKEGSKWKVETIEVYYQNTYIVPRFTQTLVTDDTELPQLLDILRECVSQNTAFPEV